MEKVIRDGKVAVLVSHGFGAGWYSWNKENQDLLFHPKLVEIVEQKRQREIDDEWVKENIGLDDVYCEGASSLKIYWLPIGTDFEILEYDGHENLMTVDNLTLKA